MASPYTSVSVSGYNANPPSDDGAETPQNLVKWSTQKEKLGDPLNTAIASVNTNVLAAFAKMVGGGAVTSTAISYGVVVGDQGGLIRATTASITITTPDATAVGAPFMFGLLNSSTGSITLDGSGSQTVNGSASLTMPAGDGYLVFTDGTNWFVIGRKTGVLPRGYIDGCIISNGTDATNDINIAAGVCRDSTNTVDITVAAMAGKQLDANWAPGAAAGMRNSAAGITDTTYHIYAVGKADGTQDIYAHTSATVATVLTALQAESGGSAYVYARVIGSIVRASSSILGFVQDGDDFQLKSPVLDETSTAVTSSASSLTLESVPAGRRVRARFNAHLFSTGSNVFIYFSDLSTTDVAATEADGTAPGSSIGMSSTATSARLAGAIDCWTNTSRQIRARGTGNVTLGLATLGWTDRRGRDA